MDTDKIKEASDAVEDLVNGYGRKAMEELANNLSGMHRTLQQSFTGGVLIPFVRIMANRYKQGGYDPRNEWACRVCSEMMAGLQAAYPEIASGECSLPLI